MANQVDTITISAVNYSVYGFTSDAMADAAGYFGGRLGSDAWTNATATQQKQAVANAVYWMERKRWLGTKTVPTQVLAFPRDSLTLWGDTLPVNTIPDQIIRGQFELALQLLSDPTIQDKATQGSNTRELKAGSASITFFRPTLGSIFDTPFPAAAQALFAPFLASGIDALTPVVAGTGDESKFGADGTQFPYGFDRGWG